MTTAQQHPDPAKIEDLDKLLKVATMITGQTSQQKYIVKEPVKENTQPSKEKTSGKNSRLIWILYIEDNLNDQMILKRTLEKYLEFFFTLITTTNTNDGLKKIEDNDFDLIILDNKLSGMTGIEFLDELKSKNIEINVILLTGQGSERIAVDAMKRGARDYITKDKLDSKDVVEIIRNLAVESILTKLRGREKAEKVVTLFIKSVAMQKKILTSIDARSDHKVSIEELVSQLEKFTESQSIIECPHCGSSTTTSYLECPECGNNQIEKENAFEHFICGCIDFKQKFESGSGLICPNCGKKLIKAGADYRKLESWFKCIKGHLFNNPVLFFKCSNCEKQFNIETANLGKIYQYPISEV
jgi:DNA-binding NarL/FixJ family response regulator